MMLFLVQQFYVSPLTHSEKYSRRVMQNWSPKLWLNNVKKREELLIVSAPTNL